MNELWCWYTHLSSLFWLWRRLFQQQRMKKDSSKSMMSSSNFLRRITGQCGGTLPHFGRLRNCCCTCLCTEESFNRSQLTFTLVMMNWIYCPLWKHIHTNFQVTFHWYLSSYSEILMLWRSNSIMVISLHITSGSQLNLNKWILDFKDPGVPYETPFPPGSVQLHH